MKKALEGCWSQKIAAGDLAATARELRKRHWLAMKEAGIDHIPSNDFSLYDHVLDTAILVGGDTRALPGGGRPTYPSALEVALRGAMASYPASGGSWSGAGHPDPSTQLGKCPC